MAKRRKQQPRNAVAPNNRPEAAEPYSVIHFDSVTEFFEYGRHPLPSNVERFDYYEKYDDRGAEWLGETRPRAMEIMRTAQWSDGAERIKTLAAGLSDVAPPINAKRRRVRSDQGDAFDIHRAWTGQFDRAWDRTQRQTARAPAPLRILVSMAISAGVDADVLAWRGAAAAALADILTESGYSVEILAGMGGIACTPKKDRVLFTVTAKHSRSPMDVHALASTIGLPAFWRIAGFYAYLATCEHVNTGICSPKSMDDECMTPERNDIGGLSEVGCLDTARRWLNECVAKINGQHEQAAA